MIDLRVAIVHADHLEDRRASYARLRAALGETPTWARVTPITGKMPPREWAALAFEACLGGTHGLVLQDDMMPCPDFWGVLRRTLEARPFDCLGLYCSHKGASQAYQDGLSWVTTCDGLIGGAYAAPASMFGELLSRWRDRFRWQGHEDTFIQTYLQSIGRFVYHPLPSLVDHDLSVEPTAGNPHHQTNPDLIRARVPWHDHPTPAPERLEARHLGRLFNGAHWLGIHNNHEPTLEDIEGAYRADRGGEPVDDTPHVFIGTLCHRPPDMLPFLRSRERAADDLVSHGIKVTTLLHPGDSYVQRGRHRLINQFLRSSCNWLLQWDDDIELLTPESVRLMVGIGHDVVGGAVPFKNDSGQTVGNLFPEDAEKPELHSVGGALRAKDVGTGFLLTSRACLTKLMARHPERKYASKQTGDYNEPLWAIFDGGVVDGEYLTEDYGFCRLWQDAGGDVYLYEPARFKHWGQRGYEGSMFQKYGLEQAVAHASGAPSEAR